MKKRICKICGAEESEDLIFHTHHIKPKSQGGTNNKKNLIDICNDCHYDIHHPDNEDGVLDDLEEEYKEAIDLNIFSDGYGIIPNKIAHNNKISSFAKLLYCDISSLCASKGYCWATNRYFSRVFNVSERTVSRAIMELEKFLVIRNKMSQNRIIWVHNLDRSIPVKKIKNIKIKKKLQKLSKRVDIKYSKDDLFLAEMLQSKILYNFPIYENKKVNISEWAEDIRKLREIDNATFEQIKFMIIWVQGGDIEVPGKPIRKFAPHDFWSKNIMSAGKLRKQWFDNLIPQLQESLKKTAKKTVVTQL